MSKHGKHGGRAPRTIRGPVALAVIVVIVAIVGGAIYAATRVAIETRGREAPLKGDDTLRTAASKASLAIAEAERQAVPDIDGGRPPGRTGK